MSKRIWKFLHSQSSWLSYKQPGSVSNENDELYTDSNLTIIFKGFLPPFDLSHKNKNKENKTDPWIGLKSNFISRPARRKTVSTRKRLVPCIRELILGDNLPL